MATTSVVINEALRLTVGSANLIELPLINERGDEEDLSSIKAPPDNGALRIVADVSATSYLLFADDIGIAGNVASYQMTQEQADALAAGDYWLYLSLEHVAGYSLELRDPIKVIVAAAPSTTPIPTPSPPIQTP